MMRQPVRTPVIEALAKPASERPVEVIDDTGPREAASKEAESTRTMSGRSRRQPSPRCRPMPRPSSRPRNLRGCRTIPASIPMRKRKDRRAGSACFEPGRLSGYLGMN